MKSFEILKSIREFTGKTQAEFSNGIISESYYSKVERGVHQVDADTFFALVNKNYWSPSLASILAEGTVRNHNKKVEEIRKHLATESTEPEKLLEYIKKVYREIKDKKEKLPYPVYWGLIGTIGNSFSEILSEDDKKALKMNIDKLKMNSVTLRKLVYTLSLYSESECLKINQLAEEYVKKEQNSSYIRDYIKMIFALHMYIWRGKYRKTPELLAQIKKNVAFAKKADSQNLKLAYEKFGAIYYGMDILGILTPEMDEAIENTWYAIFPKK